MTIKKVLITSIKNKKYCSLYNKLKKPFVIAISK